MCTDLRRRATCGSGRQHQQGLTLVELVVSLALAGVMLGTLWSAWSLMGRSSADPLVARQQLAIAQSLLREMELQPLPGGVAASAMPGRTGFASLMDYNGLTMSGITDAEGQAVPGLAAYGARIAVVQRALSGVPQPSGYWITVSVTGPDSRPLELALWRSAR